MVVSNPWKVEVHITGISPWTGAVRLFLIMELLSVQLESLESVMCFDHALHMTTYFSQKLVPLRSGCTFQCVCVFHWPETWIWRSNNSSFVHSIIKTEGQETTRTIFQSDQGPDGGWYNRSFGILSSLWPKTEGTVHHCLSVLQNVCHSVVQ